MERDNTTAIHEKANLRIEIVDASQFRTGRQQVSAFLFFETSLGTGIFYVIAHYCIRVVDSEYRGVNSIRAIDPRELTVSQSETM
jgi:hypothetical protein